MSYQLHKYYQPTEYEEMLLAAGWIDIENIDPDYKEYLSNLGGDAVEYEMWVSMKKDWDKLCSEYEINFEPLYHKEGYNLTTEEKRESDRLLKEMHWLEISLGY